MELFLLIFGLAALLSTSGAAYGHVKSGNSQLARQYKLLMAYNAPHTWHRERLIALGFKVVDHVPAAPRLPIADAFRTVQIVDRTGAACETCDRRTFTMYLPDCSLHHGSNAMHFVGRFCSNPECAREFHLGSNSQHFLAQNVRWHGSLTAAIRALETTIREFRSAVSTVERLERDDVKLEQRINAAKNVSIYGRIATDAAPAENDDLTIDVLEAERVLIRETIRGCNEKIRGNDHLYLFLTPST